MTLKERPMFLLMLGLLLLASRPLSEAAAATPYDADLAVVPRRINWQTRFAIKPGLSSAPAARRAAVSPLGIATRPAAGHAATVLTSGADGTLRLETALLGYARFLLQGTWRTTTAPSRWRLHDWRICALSAISLGAVASFDRTIRDFTQRNRSAGADEAIKTIERFGAEYAIGVLGAFFLTGHGLGDSTATHVAWDGLASTLIASQIITPALKDAFGRYRPFQTEDAYTFAPFSGHSSLPSGHATRAFSVASVIAAHYDAQWVKATAYGLAGAVAFARVYHNAHFASDVVGGALVGTSVGRAVVNLGRRQGKEPSNTLLIAPQPIPGGYRVTATIGL